MAGKRIKPYRLVHGFRTTAAWRARVFRTRTRRVCVKKASAPFRSGSRYDFQTNDNDIVDMSATFPHRLGQWRDVDHSHGTRWQDPDESLRDPAARLALVLCRRGHSWPSRPTGSRPTRFVSVSSSRLHHLLALRPSGARQIEFYDLSCW